MKVVIFYSQDSEVGRVWNEHGELKGTVNEIFLTDLKDWLIKSGDDIESYLQNLHQRFDGTFLYAGLYKEVSDLE
jgi:hypothetical protein